MALVKIPFGASGTVRSSLRQQAAEVIRARGSSDKPDSPRDIILQSGSRKCIATWVAPTDMTGVVGFRVYCPSDGTLYQEIRDPNCRKAEIALPTGATPTPANVFICSISAQLRESAHISAQIGPLAEAGAPVDPAPPPGWTVNPSGGSSNSGITAVPPSNA